MEQQDAHLRVRQTAAARVIGRAWQHVRVAIQVSGTACLALWRYDKAAKDEKTAMYTKFVRVGQIMLDHKKLKTLRSVWLQKHTKHKKRRVPEEPALGGFRLRSQGTPRAGSWRVGAGG